MFRIQWGKKLSGTIKVWGAKNAVLKIIPAALLLQKVTLKNVPNIEDIQTFLHILKWYGVDCNYNEETREFYMDSTNIRDLDWVDHSHFSDIRASIMLLSPILHRLGNICIPMPGGDKIWARWIEAHVDGLNAIGYNIEVFWEDGKDFVKWEGSVEAGDRIINASFSVTGTENIIISNVLREWQTTVKNIAIEPHVMNLIDFLRQAWADIKVRYDNTVIINGVSELKQEMDFEIISDYLQSGTYMVIAALCSQEYLDIENARIDDLYTFLDAFKKAWVKFEDRWNDTLRVYRANTFNPVKIQTNIHPGFPTDLQSLFAILMTQANGESRIHEILYEWRLGWLVEFEKMWAQLKLINPHEAKLFGPTQFEWTTVTSWDLRAWCAVVIAWLIATWETQVTNIKYIKRWYENFLENLQKLWADIEEVA